MSVARSRLIQRFGRDWMIYALFHCGVEYLISQNSGFGTASIYACRMDSPAWPFRSGTMRVTSVFLANVLSLEVTEGTEVKDALGQPSGLQ